MKKLPSKWGTLVRFMFWNVACRATVYKSGGFDAENVSKAEGENDHMRNSSAFSVQFL